jgi:hypothetical protein
MIATLCVECGPEVAVDEDGCCATCGNGATGTWLWRLVDAITAPVTGLVPLVDRDVLARNIDALTKDLAKYRARISRLENMLNEATTLGKHLAELECDSASEDRFDAIRKEAGF